MKMIQMVSRFVMLERQKVIVLCDAFFTSGNAFHAVEQKIQKLGSLYVTLITRSKADTVAFE